MSSLTAMALRFAARRALDGATFAEDRVHDSSIAPVDHMIEGGDDAAFIVVSTEDEATTVIGRDINSAERTIDIVFQVAIAHSVTGEDDGGDILIPATDAGLELSLTLIVRQALRALFEGASPWSTLFKRFAPTVKKITNQRGVGNKENGRFAARLLILTVSPLHEPPFGLVLGEDGPWAELLALMEADAELGALAPLVRQAITGTPEIPAWDRGRADQGLMIEEAQNIGIGAKFLPGEEPALATDGTLEVTPDEQRISPAGPAGGRSRAAHGRHQPAGYSRGGLPGRGQGAAAPGRRNRRGAISLGQDSLRADRGRREDPQPAVGRPADDGNGARR